MSTWDNLKSRATALVIEDRVQASRDALLAAREKATESIANFDVERVKASGERAFELARAQIPVIQERASDFAPELRAHLLSLTDRLPHVKGRLRRGLVTFASDVACTVSPALSFVRRRPVISIIAVVVLYEPIVYGVGWVLGFGYRGIRGGSVAARVQAKYPDVEAGSWFARVQSFGARGPRVVVSHVAVIVGVGLGLAYLARQP